MSGSQDSSQLNRIISQNHDIEPSHNPQNEQVQINFDLDVEKMTSEQIIMQLKLLEGDQYKLRKRKKK